MKTLFSEPITINEARRQANIIARAETLLTTGGYCAYETGNGTQVWGVYGPEGQAYTVNLREDTCECASFANDHDCKHRLALVKQLEEEQFEAMYEEWGGDERAREEGLLH